MVDPGRDSTPARVGTVRKRGLPVVIGCCVVLGGATAASAAVSGPATGSEGAISGRYQTIACDTAGRGGSARVQVGAGTPLAPALLVFPAVGGGLRSHESRSGITRYQLSKVISDNRWIVSNEIPTTAVRSTVETCADNAIRISSVPSRESAPGGSSDARRLFQLAIALAAVYVVFLAAWFWATREHRSRVGSAARF
jgi:hypothetical protein